MEINENNKKTNNVHSQRECSIAHSQRECAIKNFLKRTFSNGNCAKKKVKGGILTSIGFILSPFSWWNDLFVNIPLAYAFAFAFALINKDLFLPMMIIGYWITNVVGIMMMHYGIIDVVSKDGKSQKYTRKNLVKDFILSIAYTILVVVMVLSGLITFPIFA